MTHKSRLGTVTYVGAVGTNGAYNYGARQEESHAERTARERFWRSLGKRIRKGAA